MITSDLIGLLIMSSISCVSLLSYFLMYDIEIKFDMMICVLLLGIMEGKPLIKVSIDKA